jgi:hypothetical protein
VSAPAQLPAAAVGAGKAQDRIGVRLAPLGKQLGTMPHRSLEGVWPHDAPDNQPTDNIGDVNQTFPDLELRRGFKQDGGVQTGVTHAAPPPSATTERAKCADGDIDIILIENPLLTMIAAIITSAIAGSRI